jgi:hypothetical protein
MNINLAGIGWINDSRPYGNRLRWTFPFTQAVNNDLYLGLPERFFIERTPVNEDLWQSPDVKASDGTQVSGAWMAYPASWWSPSQDYWLTDVFTLLRLPSPAQAIHFTYHGPATLMRIKDLTNQRLLLERQITDNEFVFFASGCIEEIVFLGPAGTVHMENFSFLDLFANRLGQWELIAEIDVKAPFEHAASLAEVAARAGAKLLISDSQWNELFDLVQKARVSSPLTDHPSIVKMNKKGSQRNDGIPSAWQNLEAVLGLRWQFACLLGFGFYDGPRTDFCQFDDLREELLLRRPPTEPVAYRVRSDDPRVGSSNLVICPPYFAGKLKVPSSPNYINPEVRILQDGSMEASMQMDWIQHDFNAISVEIEETIEESHFMGNAAETNRFECRQPDPTAPLLSGSMERRFTVAWHDVTLTAKARAMDGWDRVSSFSALTGPVKLELCHDPYPPNLVSAKYISGVTSLEFDPTWDPDPIVTAANGKVFIFRRDPNKAIKTAKITLGLPVLIGSSYQAGYTAPADFIPQDYEMGSIVIGQTRLEVSDITASEVSFYLPLDSSGTVSTYTPGSATIYQNQKDDVLWIKLAELPATGLPAKVKINEPLAFPTNKADVLQYSTRLSFLGRLGPFGNIASDFRIPKAPDPPPPFSVELQGVDFYGRTLVKIILTKAAKQSERFLVWWANGDYTGQNAGFSDKAVAGLYDSQAALNGKVLFDLLPLPLDPQTHTLLSTITIGVQQVNASGGQSKFERVKI